MVIGHELSHAFDDRGRLRTMQRMTGSSAWLVGATNSSLPIYRLVINVQCCLDSRPYNTGRRRFIGLLICYCPACLGAVWICGNY